MLTGIMGISDTLKLLISPGHMVGIQPDIISEKDILYSSSYRFLNSLKNDI
jgi:hypothetical protein